MNLVASTPKKIDFASTCFHCGELNEDKAIQFNKHAFCCSGCQQVYKLLSDHSLEDYYDCEVVPGISPNAKRFHFLNHPIFRDKLINFTHQGTSKVTFQLPGIHCRSCLYLLENLYKLNSAIIKTTLNFTKKELSIWFKDSEITLGDLANFLASIGYEPFIDSEDSRAHQHKSLTEENNLFIKLGVAGFCAGNAMLFSFPEYLGIDDGDLKYLFGYLNLFLGTIAVFYSGSDYFKNVWSHLKLKKITIELPILLGILVGYLRSVYEIISHSGAGYIDSVSGLLFFLLIGKWFQQKSFDFLSFERNYTSYFPLTITKIIKGLEVLAPLQEIAIGDHVMIRNQEIIPADAILYRGNSELDYSFVTGESEKVNIKEGDSIYAGGKHQGELIEIVIVKELKQSHLTQLWEDQVFKDPIHKTENWENFANKVGVYFTYGLISLATVVGTYWYIYDPNKWQNSVVSILVIACPCALAISYPFALGHGMRWLAKFKFFIKDTQSLERLAQIDTIVFDKTGTLTLNANQGAKEQSTRPLTSFEWSNIYSLVNQSTHPISRQAKKYIQHKGISQGQKPDLFREISGKGLEGNFNGITYRVGSAQFTNYPMQASNTYQMSESQLYIQIDKEPVGYIEFPWENRPGVELMLRQLQSQYDVYLLSGDKKEHAAHILDWFPDPSSSCQFECSPMDKMNFIKSLQNQGKKVAMVGDGLNDAGAIKQAHIGIAVSDDHLHFTPASDAILQGSALPNLPKFISFAQDGLKLIKFSFVISLVYNAIGLSFAIQGTLSPLIAAILMPVNSFSMLLIANAGMNYQGKNLKREHKSYN
jgi:Cu+-exporting ATPase